MTGRPAEPADASVPFWAKCRSDACGHCWPAAWYPLDAGTFARTAGKAFCPRCGAGRPLVARQDNGQLLEPDAAGTSSPSTPPPVIPGSTRDP